MNLCYNCFDRAKADSYVTCARCHRSRHKNTSECRNGGLTSPVTIKSLPDDNFTCDYCRDMLLTLDGLFIVDYDTRKWVIYALCATIDVWLVRPDDNADATDRECVEISHVQNSDQLLKWLVDEEEKIRRGGRGGFVWRNVDQKVKFRPRSTGDMVRLAEDCQVASVREVLDNLLDLMLLAGYQGQRKKQQDTFNFIIRIYKQIRLRITEEISLCPKHFLRSWWADRAYVKHVKLGLNDDGRLIGLDEAALKTAALVCNPPHKLILAEKKVLHLIKQIPFEKKYVVVELGAQGKLENQYVVGEVEKISCQDIYNTKKMKPIAAKEYRKAQIYLEAAEQAGHDINEICDGLTQETGQKWTDTSKDAFTCPDASLDDIAFVANTAGSGSKLKRNEIADEERLAQMSEIVLCSICRHLIPGDFNTMSEKAEFNDGIEHVKDQIGAIKYNVLSDQYYCRHCYDHIMQMADTEDIAIMKEAFVNLNTIRSVEPADQSAFIQGADFDNHVFYQINQTVLSKPYKKEIQKFTVHGAPCRQRLHSFKKNVRNKKQKKLPIE